MTRTSLSLLQQISRNEPDSWARLTEIYTPLLSRWIRQHEVQPADADDLTQEVLLTVSSEIDGFRHTGREGAFRAWLKGILINRIRNYWRQKNRRATGDSAVQEQLRQLEDPASELSALWNQQHDEFVVRQIMQRARTEFAASTWKAFQQTAIENQPASDVARELQLTTNAVFIARSRVIRRLRELAAGLVESSQFGQ